MNRLCIILLAFLAACSSGEGVRISHNDTFSRIDISGNPALLLLPIEESAPEARIDYRGRDGEIMLNVRLARSRVDYTMPLELCGQQTLRVRELPADAVAWQHFATASEFTPGDDKFRPEYHFAPAYGWMNDPNGMFYKDGEYHLYYQHNPYASVWGNMHWGHAVSRDLVNWKHLPEAIVPDSLGAVFSGSCVVDERNVTGFGAGAVVAFYTSAGERQTQSVAYSTDNGLTFRKYEGNPVLTSEEIDFRDPKVIWHQPTGRYIMVLAVGNKMEFYSSANLLDWQFESRFGEEYGCHGGVWECPDLLELAVDGNSGDKRWVLICNINPGGPSGGSASQYFVGNFDGKTFTCEDKPETVKWMDFGKDHYAAVTWAGAPDGRAVTIAWMSNWQYANQVPTKWFRSSNTIARDLSLFSDKGAIRLASTPSPEIDAKKVAAEKSSGCSEICFSLKPTAPQTEFRLVNRHGEAVVFRVDFRKGLCAIDRGEAGESSFSEEFAVVTEAPVFGRGWDFRLFTDRASVECFINGGKTVLTNLVFPSDPLTEIIFGEGCEVENLKIYNIVK